MEEGPGGIRSRRQDRGKGGIRVHGADGLFEAEVTAYVAGRFGTNFG